MKLPILILAVLMLSFLGCKKDIVSPTEPECLYLGRDTSFGQFSIDVSFYYDNNKKLVGRAFIEEVKFLQLGISLYLPAFDSVVYVSSNKVITYHYPFQAGATNTSFNKDKIPEHSTVYSKKTEFTYQDNRLIRIDYFDKNVSFLNDSLVYEGDKLVKIYKTGTIEFRGSNPNSQKICVLDYDGSNLKSFIGVTRDNRNKVIERDTTLYSVYSNLKNPYKKLNYLADYFIESISTNAADSIVWNSYDYNSIPIFPYITGHAKYNYLDNGKGYPKQAGFYKCD
jgi:hypothetical protein